ncbi:hypothetical protein RJ639_029720 [Escallonia herrerae]|uniref:Pentatricopeptide repeat-containing protein n=1 Tax=Escallonia herrerae TaxID=1293975 RepID=A0AA88XE39_9ASTE|nr:hypothetical protein RJ639_029720 [Escallonia herrerae]
MNSLLPSCSLYHSSQTHLLYQLSGAANSSSTYKPPVGAQSNTRIYHRKLSKNLRYPRRTKLPPELGVNTFLKKKTSHNPSPVNDPDFNDGSDEGEEMEENVEGGDENPVWDPDEIETISSLFRGRIPQKPGKLNRERPLPLPLPYKLRPLGLPTPKKRPRTFFLSKQVYKSPSFLIELAKEIKALPAEEDACGVLSKSAIHIRKGSLSLTIRELGHMDLPERALQVFCWAQKQPQLFPDDRILASTVEVLARTRELKMPFTLENLVNLASRSVYEAMLRGFIRGGSLKLALKLVSAARDGKRVLDPSIYAKLILELGKNPDKHTLVLTLLEELGEREDLNLTQQDCTAVMKVCIRLGKFEIVESLFSWFKLSGHDPSVVMYTTLIYSRFREEKYREALAVVWEMEGLNCLFDLPAYRVVIKLFVALNDLSRAVRYFFKLKEAGFSPTFDIYRVLIRMYLVSGRMAKCKELCKEAEMAGYKLDKETRSQLLQLGR